MAGAPRVSVIMPLYNAAEFVTEAIRSVQLQTLEDWELVVVDDCSSDATAKTVQAIAGQDKRIKLLKMPQRSGPTVVRNRALAEAQGRFVAFLDGDDVWLPNKLQKQVEILEDSPHALCCASYAVMEQDGTLTGRVRTVKDRTYSLHDILSDNVIGCLTAVVDTQKSGSLQLSDVYRIAEDYALWISILRQGHTAVGTKDIMAYYRLTRGSYSSRKLRVAQGVWKVFRHENWMPLWKAVWYFAGYAVRRAPRVFERI